MGKPNVQVLQVYGFDEKENSDRHGTVFNDPSLTRQSEAADADINTIVRRFGLTGGMPPDHRPIMYGDFTGITDFQSAFAAVADAQERFAAMPADVRSRFDNDPQKFLVFASQESNREEMKKMGLLVPDKVDPAPQKVEIVNAEIEPAKPARVVIPPKGKSSSVDPSS